MNLTQETLTANLDLPRHDLVVFTWGNVSGIDRQKGQVVIKPSGVPYDEMTEEHMVTLDLDGNVIAGSCKPSSDTPTHLELYRKFPQIGGIVHTHSRWATIWSQACQDLLPYGTTHADYFYGAVPCTRPLKKEEIEQDYELHTGQVIVETFRQRRLDPAAVPGVFVAGHGPFAFGKDAHEAVHHAVVLEECARMAYFSRSLTPDLASLDQTLLDKHYLRKHGKDAYYGQK